MKGRGKKREISYGTITDWLKICDNDLGKLEACLMQLSLSGKMGNWAYFGKCLPDWSTNGKILRKHRPKPGQQPIDLDRQLDEELTIHA